MRREQIEVSTGPSAKYSPFLAGVVGLCLLGVAFSIELTRIHYLAHTDPTFHSVCAVSEGVNCETVALSPYSVFAGLPVSIWGIAGYLTLALIALTHIAPLRLHPWWPSGIVTLLVGATVAVSAVLASIAALHIDSLCLFCTATFAVNLTMLGLVFGGLHSSKTGPLRALLEDLRALAARPALPIVGVTVGVALVACTEIAIESYWKAPGWDELIALPHGVDEQGQHWIGSPNPAATVVEFSDYECPHCRRAHQRVRQMVVEHPDELRLIHRHLPLDRRCHPQLKHEFHGRACLFAEAAECAGQQGKFWEMNDALFAIQETTATNEVEVEELAVRLGLDRSSFAGCLQRGEAADKVVRDLQAALARGMTGTPTYLLGDEQYKGMIQRVDVLRALRRGGTLSAQR
jgi:uncharacterized membrane protein/predicted DsbA family dithiol-disulfide isomerase